MARNRPDRDCVSECCLKTTLDQTTKDQMITTGQARIPYMKNSAVPGPPTPAAWTDTFDHFVAIIIPAVTVI